VNESGGTFNRPMARRKVVMNGDFSRVSSVHKKQSVRNKLCLCGADLVKLKRSSGVTYWVSYRLPGGKQKRESAGTSIEDARAAEGKRRGQKKENRIFDIKADAKMIFPRMSDWYLSLESIRSLKSFMWVETKLGIFNQTFGNRIVSTIKPSELETIKPRGKRLAGPMQRLTWKWSMPKAVINKAFSDDLVGGKP